MQPKERLFDVAALNDPRNLMSNPAEQISPQGASHHDFAKHRKSYSRHNCGSACTIALGGERGHRFVWRGSKFGVVISRRGKTMSLIVVSPINCHPRHGDAFILQDFSAKDKESLAQLLAKQRILQLYALLLITQAKASKMHLSMGMSFFQCEIEQQVLLRSKL